MFERVLEALAVIRDAVASAELAEADGPDAVRYYEAFAEGERLSSAGRTVAGRRIEQTRAWHATGFPSPAAFLAARAQTTVGSAIAMLETGRRLDNLPATREAFLSGSLSALQTQEIAAAAESDNTSEASLLEAAQTERVSFLRQQCRQVIAAATRNDPDRYERIRRERYVRFWTDADGSRRMDVKLTPDAGAKLEAVVEPIALELRDDARKAGSREKLHAYRADALISLVDSPVSSPRATVNVHIDLKAFTRGYVERGEECSIEGTGPVPVPAVQRLANDAYIRAVLKDGADVRAIETVGRPIPPRIRRALEARDQTCVVPGCDNRRHLEIHHLKPICEGGRTSMENCCRICLWHHILVTSGYWRIEGKPGAWRWARMTSRTRDGPD